MNHSTNNNGKQRKISWWRVSLAVIIVLVGIPGGVWAYQNWHKTQTIIPNKPWFGAYVDVTATPLFQFQQMGTTQNKDAILSFIVASPQNSCTPTWGGAYTISQATASLDLDTRIARLQQQGGSVAISFGGRDNKELSIACTDNDKLISAYKSVIDHYHINTIDLDIEGSALSDTYSETRRATAIAKIQSDMRADGKDLAVWATLPVNPDGLTQEGTDAISLLLTNGVDLAGVNIMTMDYGNSLPSNETMQAAAQSAATQTERQLNILYKLHGLYLNDSTLWSKIGLTPMIGQNDDANEIFTLDDAQGLNTFALAKGIGRMSMWSANRDNTCGSNYIDVSIVSTGCSGVNEDKETFAQALGSGFTGNISLSAGFVTTASSPSMSPETPDDPAKSPYQIWSPTGAYLAQTKVVWHHYIYIAKWWTQGDIPDNPVLQSWQTPWELIGPVLPGQTPIPQPTLPAGTYPNWSGTTIYNAGDRVLFGGVPYQAKWWNQGESPAAATSNPTSSPWVQLTQSQINQILSGK